VIEDDIAKAFDRHTRQFEAGIQAMSPAPRHRIPIVRVGDPDPNCAVPAPEPVEDKAQFPEA
jgi:hypothetical protein